MSSGSADFRSCSHEEPSGVDMQLSVASEEDEEDVCRICRMPAEPDNALFFPCKCSGSIKYVHQQCLVEWLNHSGNTHCEVCKHKFSFTPVYAKDAPAVLPWYQLLFGLLKRGTRAVRVAHRIWLVCSIWLVIVPLCTGLAWRIAFAQSAMEAAQIVLKRFSVLALITDCIQGSLLSITIVFLNMGFSSLKDYLRQCIRALEQQLLHSLPTGNEAHADAAPFNDVPVSEHENAGVPVIPHPNEDDGLNVNVPAPAAEQAELHLAGALDNNDEGPDRIHDENQAEIPFEELIGLQGPWLNFVETIALVTIGNAFFMFMAIWVPLNVGRFGLNVWKQSLQVFQERHMLEHGLMAGSSTLANETAALNLTADFATQAAVAVVTNVTSMLANVTSAAVGAVAAVAPVAAAAGKMAGDLAQSVSSNVTEVFAAAAQSLSGMDTTVAEGVMGLAASSLAQPQCGLVRELANGSAMVLEAAAAGVQSGQVGGMLLATAGNTAPVPEGVPSGRGGLLGTAPQDSLQMYPIQPLMLMVVTMEQMVKELQGHLEPPPRADFVALGLGHVFLLLLAFLCLWAYVSVRLWNLHARRAYIFTQQSVWQVLNTATSWAMGTLAQVVKLLKLGILLVVELGVFPLATGVWLDLCLLPLTNSTMEQRVASFWTAPLLLAFIHWLLGVAFMLAFTFLVCMTREVLRPGALPFLKDPTNPERNPIREMMEEPLVTHLARVSLSCILYAALCVTLVHFPALLARLVMPQLFPLRLYFLDPFTQIPADMLLFHVCVPFTVEHVKLKALVKAVIRHWLRLVGSLLGLEHYLLLPPGVQQGANEGADAQRVEADAPQAQADASHATAGVPPTEARPDASVAEPVAQADPNTSAAVSPGVDHTPAAVSPQVSAESGLACSVAAASSSVGPGIVAPTANTVSSSGGSDGYTSTSRASPSPAYQDRVRGTTSSEPADHASPASNPVDQAAEPASAAAQRRGTAAGPLPPLAFFEEQANYPVKLVVMGVLWAVSMVLVGAAFFVVPVSIGRFIFSQLHLLLKNDLYSGALGMYALWGLLTMCKSAAAMANFGNMSAALRAGWRWLVLFVKCTCLAVLWLGVVATMLGILVELVLLPLHHNPAQSPLMFWYQDWTMGVLGLKLWHLVIMLTPRREGAPPPPENSWQAHFEALQRDGLLNLNFVWALRYIILPVMMHLAVAMAIPYVITRVLLPCVPCLPQKALDYANLYAYTVAFVLYVSYKAARQLHTWLNDLHNAIRDDWYLVGRELNNFQDGRNGRKLLTARNNQADGELAPISEEPLVAGEVSASTSVDTSAMEVTRQSEAEKAASIAEATCSSREVGVQTPAAAETTNFSVGLGVVNSS